MSRASQAVEEDKEWGRREGRNGRGPPGGVAASSLGFSTPVPGAPSLCHRLRRQELLLIREVLLTRGKAIKFPLPEPSPENGETESAFHAFRTFLSDILELVVVTS